MSQFKLSKKSRVALIYRTNTAAAMAASSHLIEWLIDHEIKPVTAPEQSPLPKAPLMKSSKEFDSVELVIVLGGDGTYLRANRQLEGRPIPILGVNLGSLGFLTPLKVDNLYKVLPLILKGQYGELVPRTQMLVQLSEGKKKTAQSWQALNDVVIERGPSSHLIDLKLGMELSHVSSIKADGVVLATPTGSTAYNLAAGGPILNPETPCFVATSVAPHSLTSRPLIFPDTKELKIELQGQCDIAHLVIDGQKCAELTKRHQLRVSKHIQPHWMLQATGHNFYDLLREKLSFGERS